MRRAIVLFTALAVLAVASNKEKPRPPASSGAENDHLELQATVLLDKDDIRNAVGAELPAGIAVVQIKAIPKGDDPLSIGRDDFTLLMTDLIMPADPFAAGR